MSPLFVRLCIASLACFGYVACSSDGGAPIGSSTPSTGGKAGGSSSGGARSTGGATGSGGFDPALAAQCSIDSKGSDCKMCLAAVCCDAVKPCFAEPACMAAFSTYQTCVNDPAEVDHAGCLATFVRFARSDGGVHQSLAGCIITGGCQLCGGVDVL